MRMNLSKLIVSIILFLAFSFGQLRASDWQKVVELKGTWSFSIGDYPEWAKSNVDISDWHKINVPDAWEKYYPGYNGFAWYRKSFDFKSLSGANNLVLFLGYIDDVDEVFINGIKIGQSGKFPPEKKTAYNVERKYTIPEGILNSTQNYIAIRVYDEGMEGGILRGERIGIYIDRDKELLLYDLSGKWKFTNKKDKQIHSVNMEDGFMDEIYVPSCWEFQGYPGYDGYGWYRKEFLFPKSDLQENLYLVLGQIDDLDKVYLNGKLIGSTKELEAYSRINSNNASFLYRSYKIPDGLLREKNLLSVEVYDRIGEGGIYSGPIGIMTEENNAKFMEQNSSNREFNSFWDIIDYLFNQKD